jgi:hypothetical protein
LIGRFEQILIDLKRVRESGALQNAAAPAATNANNAALHVLHGEEVGVNG